MMFIAIYGKNNLENNTTEQRVQQENKKGNEKIKQKTMNSKQIRQINEYKDQPFVESGSREEVVHKLGAGFENAVKVIVDDLHNENKELKNMLSEKQKTIEHKDMINQETQETLSQATSHLNDLASQIKQLNNDIVQSKSINTQLIANLNDTKLKIKNLLIEKQDLSEKYNQLVKISQSQQMKIRENSGNKNIAVIQKNQQINSLQSRINEIEKEVKSLRDEKNAAEQNLDLMSIELKNRENHNNTVLQQYIKELDLEKKNIEILRIQYQESLAKIKDLQDNKINLEEQLLHLKQKQDMMLSNVQDNIKLDIISKKFNSIIEKQEKEISHLKHTNYKLSEAVNSGHGDLNEFVKNSNILKETLSEKEREYELNLDTLNKHINENNQLKNEIKRIKEEYEQLKIKSVTKIQEIFKINQNLEDQLRKKDNDVRQNIKITSGSHCSGLSDEQIEKISLSVYQKMKQLNESLSKRLEESYGMECSNLVNSIVKELKGISHNSTTLDNSTIIKKLDNLSILINKASNNEKNLQLNQIMNKLEEINEKPHWGNKQDLNAEIINQLANINSDIQGLKDIDNSRLLNMINTLNKKLDSHTSIISSQEKNDHLVQSHSIESLKFQLNNSNVQIVSLQSQLSDKANEVIRLNEKISSLKDESRRLDMSRKNDSSSVDKLYSQIEQMKEQEAQSRREIVRLQDIIKKLNYRIDEVKDNYEDEILEIKDEIQMKENELDNLMRENEELKINIRKRDTYIKNINIRMKKSGTTFIGSILSFIIYTIIIFILLVILLPVVLKFTGDDQNNYNGTNILQKISEAIYWTLDGIIQHTRRVINVPNINIPGFTVAAFR